MEPFINQELKIVSKKINPTTYKMYPSQSVSPNEKTSQVFPVSTTNSKRSKNKFSIRPTAGGEISRENLIDLTESYPSLMSLNDSVKEN